MPQWEVETKDGMALPILGTAPGELHRSSLSPPFVRLPPTTLFRWVATALRDFAVQVFRPLVCKSERKRRIRGVHWAAIRFESDRAMPCLCRTELDQKIARRTVHYYHCCRYRYRSCCLKMVAKIGMRVGLHLPINRVLLLLLPLVKILRATAVSHRRFPGCFLTLLCFVLGTFLRCGHSPWFLLMPLLMSMFLFLSVLLL
mmetsp:Transcript_28020/g.61746  ORF Transcript_28020/g.61746 Transcript_28020/m.61746 type:complete len:201 (-) Transcript_28020:212-814(-)